MGPIWLPILGFGCKADQNRDLGFGVYRSIPRPLHQTPVEDVAYTVPLRRSNCLISDRRKVKSGLNESVRQTVRGAHWAELGLHFSYSATDARVAIGDGAKTGASGHFGEGLRGCFGRCCCLDFSGVPMLGSDSYW